MTASRLLAAAFAATLASTAALAAPPTADQVTVPRNAENAQRHGKMMALFSSPEEFAMFKMELRKATHGMDHAQKKAYRRDQIRKIRAMTEKEKAVWRKDLDAKWAALPSAKRERIAQKMQSRRAKRQAETSAMQPSAGAMPPPAGQKAAHTRRGETPPPPSDDEDDTDNPQ